MDKIRIYVWIALAGLLYIAFFTWQKDYPAPPPPTTQSSAAAPLDTVPALPPTKQGESTPAVPAPNSPVTSTALPLVAATSPAPQIRVTTDVFDLSISLRGGEFVRADLIRYPVDGKQPDRFVRLFESTSDTYFFARSGLRSAQEASAPTDQSLFSAPAQEFSLASGQDVLSVPLTWTDDNGITVTKTFTFKRGQYVIDLQYAVDNRTANEWGAASYVTLARRQPIIETSMLHAESYAFRGPSIYDGKSKDNLKLKDEGNRDLRRTFTGGWMAAMQHHFVVAAVPKHDQEYEYRLAVESPQQFSISYRGPVVQVPAGASGTFSETFFVGPKIQTQLEPVGSRLELTADYGRLTIVAGPLFAVLSWVHGFIGNWGWSIILVTLLIKLVFYKLTEASGKSMAKMRELAPRLKALQERYKDNREELGRATMELYKREKVNPLAGCLPMLVQMPVWMAFYWVILNSAEMRQAPFIGYLTDLSTRDPYFILPILLGVANFVQFKLNPAPADPVQAKVMMVMPIGMSALMAFFPAGLALYWITNTGLSIAQQWHINRVVMAQSKKN